MAGGYKCYNCKKGVMVGHNVSHAKNRTRKVFKPNLHPAKMTVEGRSFRVRLCTKCLRELRGRSTRAKKALRLLQESSLQDKQGKPAIEVSSATPASNAAGAVAAGLV